MKIENALKMTINSLYIDYQNIANLSLEEDKVKDNLLD